MIKPCPFCGGEARVDKYEEWPDCSRVIYIYWGAGCDTDGCWCELDHQEFYLKTEEEAIEQ